MYASEAGNIMSESFPFAGTYYDTALHRVFSLRSRESGIDVSEIAVRFGGGGHKHAAGFKVDRSHALAKM
jgi:nanoRNase/pAp phosphatase (c-di-AMP/oligoRNAs hydrolase)